jgi:Recombinase
LPTVLLPVGIEIGDKCFAQLPAPADAGVTGKELSTLGITFAHLDPQFHTFPPLFPNGARALKGKQVGNRRALAAIKTRAQEHALTLRAIVADVQVAGITSVRAIADELNRRAILTPRRGQWHPTSVVRLLERLAA